MADKKMKLNTLLDKYSRHIYGNYNSDYELEIRFGTIGRNTITKIQFYKVIEYLLSNNFNKVSDDHILKIQNEYINNKTGRKMMSSIRTELNGINNIKKYCKTNNVNEISDLKLYNKAKVKNESGEPIRPVDYRDFNFRISLQSENNILKTSNFGKNIINNWGNNKKIFRHMNRITYKNSNFPVRIDMSIVKESHKKKYLIPEYTVQEAKVFDSIEKYEIEIEFDNNAINSRYSTFNVESMVKDINDYIKKLSRIILSGLQDSYYPIPYSITDKILTSYMKVIHDEEYIKNPKNQNKYTKQLYVSSRNFIGPSSYTLQMENIIDNKDMGNSYVSNIRNNYTVTEKADGQRKLLYIHENGLIYLIDMNMNVQFTGAKTNNTDIVNTIIDGEHIIYDNNNERINLFACFDIYYIKNKDIRSLEFVPLDDDDVENNFRLPLLKNVVKSIKPVSVIKNNDKSPFNIEVKTFVIANKSQDIFECCKQLLDQTNMGLFDYEVDGLILTPSSLGVGQNKKDDEISNFKITWDSSFKWKPEKFNTIDFLVSTVKNESEMDIVNNLYEDGSNVTKIDDIIQYKTLTLRVGYSQKKHGYINPCQMIIDDDAIEHDTYDNKRDYKPVPFHPTDPYDPNAYVCNIKLIRDKHNNYKMFTEEGEVFDDNTIVEFKYVKTNPEKWRWVPLRIRNDKTEEYKSGKKNYGNAYHVANSNWHTIHNPITEEMITTGKDIPNNIAEDVYYKKYMGESYTVALRNFHNLYVKNKLIKIVSNKNDTLIDYAVGKGGDLPKWIRANLSFIFGIDIMRDNIENKLDGVCARYLNYKKKFKKMPKALFVNGNTSINIKSTDAIYTDKGKMVTNAVFGKGPKDKTKMGTGVYNQYGVGKDGFNISSIQFALHYMFENKSTLHNFLRNISECTKVGGYFIGTCYDGKKIFNKLKNKKEGESIQLYVNNKKIWEIEKQYSFVEFDDDDTSIGYSINVYQETINKYFREYLVNFEYFTQLMNDYGFSLLKKEELKKNRLNKSCDSFSVLYKNMLDENEKFSNNFYKDAANMTEEEKKISFLNNYCIFKKTHSIDAKKLSNNFISNDEIEELDNILLNEDPDVVETEIPIDKKGKNNNIKAKKIKKIKKKLLLKQ